jgi:5-methylcytosine-specific restriction endonuclease McrA
MVICSIEGCDRRNHAKGFCQRHYMRFYRHSDPLAGASYHQPPGTVCLVDGCEKRHATKGYCHKHFARLTRQTDEWREWKRKYNRQPHVREAENRRLRERYATDPEYRARILTSQASRPSRTLKQRSPEFQKEWRRLLLRYNGLCAYCGVQPGTTLEHVIPRSRGGTDKIGNLLPACNQCNASKGALLLTEFKRWRGDYLKWQIKAAFRSGIKAERMERDPRCAECGTDLDLELHHIVKRSQGHGYRDGEFGVDDPSNLVLLCRKHHREAESNPQWSTA